MADYSLALNVKPLQLEDPLTSYGRFATIQNAQNQNALAQYQLAAAQRAEAQQNALYEQAQNPEFKLDFGTALRYGAPGIAAYKAQREAETQGLQAAKLRGEINAQPGAMAKTEAETKKLAEETRERQVKALGLGLIGAMKNPDDATLKSVFDHMDTTGINTKPYRAQFDNIQDVAARQQIIQQYALSNPEGRQALEFVSPKPTTFNLGGKEVSIDMNPHSPTYKTELVSYAKTPAPAGPSSLAVLQAEEAALPEGDPRKLEIKQKIKKETQNAPHYVSSGQGVMAVDPQTNKATPVLVNGKPLLDSSTELGQAQLKIAARRLNISEATEKRLQEEADSSGGLSPQALDIAAQMVLQSGVMPPLGSGKRASEARVQVMNRVAEMTGTDAAAGASNIIGNQQNTLAAKATLKDFTSGISSRRVVANNTAINHLETMDKLAADLNNRDTRIFNAAGNAFAAATGQSAPTSFDAAKQLVAAEVIKAVVSNGGGVTERQEAAQNFSRANSPQQLKEVINTYRELLGGQLQSLEGQYKAGTNRDDFRSKFLTPNTQKVLPAAPAAPAAAKTPSDIPQAAIDFLKQGRGTREQFDAQFGAGSAKKVLGG